MKLGFLWAAISLAALPTLAQAQQKFDFKIDLKKMIESGSVEQGISTSSSNTPDAAAGAANAAGAGAGTKPSGGAISPYEQMYGPERDRKKRARIRALCQYMITNLGGADDHHKQSLSQTTVYADTRESLQADCLAKGQKAFHSAMNPTGRNRRLPATTKFAGVEFKNVEEKRNWKCVRTYRDGYRQEMVVEEFNAEKANDVMYSTMPGRGSTAYTPLCTPA